ncbi:DHHC palmitoyltransferase-domain-containing protein [Mycena metata]|uniref:Palmitoyltransferase n=1 Tax=Mycena metata TaxID=1033252 RepID=A0AAD7IV02_9AGAR|nr:DHHC palmitoyltransferase-domain-containing protein [Mycena metata]
MSARNAAPPSDKFALDKPTFCGTITEARYTARERREARAETPQPWVVRKLMVVFTLGIMIYTGYVYAGRFVVRLIDGGRRGEGIGLLVPWCFLYLWMLWAYVKVIITPPGTANDYVEKTPQPLFPRAQLEAHQADQDLYSGGRTAALEDIEAGRIGGPAYEHIQGSAVAVNPDALVEPPAARLGVTREIQIPENGYKPTLPPPPPRRKSSWGSKEETSGKRVPRGRFPPTTAPLLPPHRWCKRCSIVKPYRAHHCRICGTCILKFDHHCPWIGQCVGARNHKFFLNFAFATFIFTTFTFASLLSWNANSALTHGGDDVDPQEVVIIALAALFALFTSSLGIAHTRMVLLSQTTVENLGVQRMREHERAGLEAAGVACWDVGAKRRALEAYDEEWGSPNTEGNVWWAGSARAGWEDVMGKNVVGWVLPIGAPLGDGLHYQPNPRFDADGRWRRRSEWPAGLR